jgi:hypothetical protein
VPTFSLKSRFTVCACVLGMLLGLNGFSGFLPTSFSEPASPSLQQAATEKASLGKPVVKTASSVKNMVEAQTVTPLALVKDPAAYLNKAVKFEAEFRGFSSMGLDYKPAFREAKDYVTLLVRRPDVSHHIIPLSELKLFYPRKEAEMLSKLEPGDKVRFQGKVFSTALGDPWLDVSFFTITEAVKRKAEDEETPSSALEGQE